MEDCAHTEKRRKPGGRELVTLFSRERERGEGGRDAIPPMDRSNNVEAQARMYPQGIGQRHGKTISSHFFLVVYTWPLRAAGTCNVRDGTRPM